MSRLFDETDRQTEDWRIYSLVALLALVLRGIYLAEILPAPFLGQRMGDAEIYHLWARQIAQGNWLGDKVFYQAPLYPYFLAVIYCLANDAPLTVRLVHLALGCGSCVLLAMAARSFFGRREALIAGLILAFYAPAIFLDGLIQKSALGLFLTTALLAMLGRLTRCGGAIRSGGSGVLLGLLVLTRENTIVLVPLLLLWVMAGLTRHRFRTRLMWAGLLLAGLGLVLMPIGLRNWRAGEFHITTSQAGTNFYIGNNPESDGTYTALRFGRGDASYERGDAQHLAEQELGRSLSPTEVSHYWFTKAISYIRERPRHWLRLMVRKLALTVNVAEVPDTEDHQVYAQWSVLLRALGPVLNFGVLFPVASFGLILTLPSWRRLWILYLITVAYAASVVMFYVFARYRFPLVPPLILLAAAGMVESGRTIRQRSYRRFVFATIVAVLAAITSNWPIYSTRSNLALSFTNIAVLLAEDPAQTQSAIDFYERALAIRPDYAKAHNDLGRLLAKMGRVDAAIGHYQQAVKLQPDYVGAHYNLAVAYSLPQIGHEESSMDHYAKVLQLDNRHAEAHNNLGTLLAQRGQTAEAAEHFSKAVELRPDYEDAVKNQDRARRLLKEKVGPR